jgi:four helix bundle protein
MSISSYRDLRVWQESKILVKEVYLLTKTFPKEELYALTSQMRRAVISIPSNIAEGHSRLGVNDFSNFVSIAIGSLAELQTQLELSVDIGYCQQDAIDSILGKINAIQRMLHKLRQSLQVLQRTPPKTNAQCLMPNANTEELYAD